MIRELDTSEKKDELWTIFKETVSEGGRTDRGPIKDFTSTYKTQLRGLDAELSAPLPPELKGLLIAANSGLRENQVL